MLKVEVCVILKCEEGSGDIQRQSGIRFDAMFRHDLRHVLLQETQNKRRCLLLYEQEDVI